MEKRDVLSTELRINRITESGRGESRISTPHKEFPIKFLEFVICSDFVKHYSGFLGRAPFEIQNGIVEMQNVFNPSYDHQKES